MSERGVPEQSRNGAAWSRFRYDARRRWVLLRRYGPGQIQFWFIALLIGIVAGYATVAFRLIVSWLQQLFYGADDLTLASHAATLPWWKVLIIPILGGLAVGYILRRFTPDGRVRSVAHVIEGAAMRRGRVERKAGKASVIASIITLSTGGSTGREGPVVHMGAALSTMVSDFIKADGITARDLMGCATAAAVAASFNAPIAGAIFALEVVLRHFAVHAFAPIAIASVAGAVVSRSHLGDLSEFDLPPTMLAFYAELPAFMILGLICGVVAVVMMRMIFLTEELADRAQARTGIPNWLRPGIAGLFLGIIALEFPHIIGVGYETTYRALNGDIFWLSAALFAVVKVVAVAITVAGRMGGGVFSPALMLGALTGLTFGYIATSILPEWSGHDNIYAIAGMAGVAAAVLGGPISTTLIAFEIIGDWQIAIAVLVTVSLSTILASRMVNRSYFLTQLERRGIHLADGPQAYLLSTIAVEDVMRPLSVASPKKSRKLQVLLDKGSFLNLDTTLEVALPYLETSSKRSLPVARVENDERILVGVIYYTDALKAYTEALARVAKEEHS
jgi:CIC family chloride channel protein